MAILEIIEAPHPLLALKAREVREDEFGEALAAHVSDMAETMYAAPGVGLAAPQVGDSRCVVVADPGSGEEDEGRVLYQMVNPRIVARSRETTEGEEQCLSVPELTVKVKRHERVEIAWRDPWGEAHQQWFDGWAAVVVQHELDHLTGTTLYDRASALKRSRYLRARKKATQREPSYAR